MAHTMTTDTIKPLLRAHHVPLPVDAVVVGMEKWVVPTVGHMSLAHRRQVWQDVAYAQSRRAAEASPARRAAWMRRAVGRHSVVSHLMARYMAFLVASETTQTQP